MATENSFVATGKISRGHAEIEFVDQYGERRTIHRNRSGDPLRLKKRADSPSHLLNRAAAVLIGQNIRRARIAAGLTLADLLLKAGLEAAPGLAKSRMFEIERGGVGVRKNKQGIRFGTLYAIAMALGCEPAALLPSTEEVAAAAGISCSEEVVTRVRKTA